MSVLRRPPIAAAAACAAIALAAGCGQATGADSGGSGGSGGAWTQAAVTPPSGAQIGAGASYSPAGSIFYMSSPETGPAWAELTTVRNALPKEYTQLGTSTGALGTLLGEQLTAPNPSEWTSHGFGLESSMTLLSDHVTSGNAPDLLFYQSVTDRSKVVSWIAGQGHVRQAAPEDGYDILAGTGLGSGTWAVSGRVALWASTEAEARAAVRLGADGGPSLAQEPGFRAAMSRVDATGAAIVGYSRVSIERDLELAAYSGAGDAPWARLASAFGFHDMGFVVAARSDHGVVLRGFPSEGVYQPGAPYRPQLPAAMPAGMLGFADANDVASLLPAADAAAQILGAHDFRSARAAIGHDTRLSSDQIDALLQGEDAVWFGDAGSGFGTSSPDPEAAEAALRAYADGQHTIGSGDATTVQRAGSLVLAEQYDKPVTRGGGAEYRRLADRAGMPERVSLVAYVNTGGFGSGFQDNPEPNPPTQRLLLWTLPRSVGWEFDLYIEATA